MNRARFLLAQLHMDSLRDKTSPKLIKKALEILPKGSNALDLAYDGAMQRIEGQMEGFRLRAKQLLGWLTYSERLMTVKEVQHALAIEPGTPELDEDNLSDVNEIVALCAGLIIIDEETQIIRLVHYTTQEYFRRNGETLLACAQQDMATSCLTYLLYEKFGDGWVFDVDQSLYGWIDARLRRYPFLGYAARYWATHASVCGQRNVKALTMSFVKDHRRVSSASQAILALDEFWLFDNIDETKSRAPLSAMHFVAYLGHEETISELLSHGFDADAKDSFHQTPLWWAASQGHEAVVSLLLLQSHVNVNDRGLTSSDGYGRDTSATPLSIAAAGGKDKIVKLLIQREDVDVNLPNTFSESPLSVATRGGYVTVVELLLTRRDIDVNSRNKMGKTSLCIAARYGADDIAQQLLEQKNIQVNLADMDRLTPLAWAASGGKEKIMKALLARSDIEVNRQDHWGRTPLFSAVETKNEALVKLLLSHSDIDVNRRNSAGRTALHIAAVWGYAPLVKLLTSRTDIEVNSKDESGSTAMHQAAKEGQPATVELLLGCVGIDVNLEDVYGCTLLHKAVEECGPLTVKDIPWFDDRSDEEAKQECEAVVAMLLGYVGIEVNPKDYEGKTPLATAVKFHQPAVVRLLCAHPDVDLVRTFRGYPILFGSTFRFSAISLRTYEGLCLLFCTKPWAARQTTQANAFLYFSACLVDPRFGY